MRVLALEINGFRSIQRGRLVFSDHMTFVGPNGSGKSTIVDALSLAFGRQKLVRELTEHDFWGSCPVPEDRIRIVVTLGGFSTNDPADHPQWFRQDRAIEKWWNRNTSTADAERSEGSELCVQIGYAARFDQDELVVDQKRYFHDDDDVVDPFDEEGITTFPHSLLSEIGFFVLPARRTWASTISFASELFRRAISTVGGFPASSLLKQRDELRGPPTRLEDDPAIKPLVDSIDAQMAQLLPGNPRLQLRVTSTDSESLLQALVPHFTREGGKSLPAYRHGMGLVSLQTFVLLLEIGRARTKNGQSLILAIEEPELHVPPGLQRRLIGEAEAVSDQLICTTHSPRLAAFFDPQKIQILARGVETISDRTVECIEGRPLAPSSMVGVPNSLNQLYTDDRARLVEALMFTRVLVPEGRIDFEWLRLLVDITESGERALQGNVCPLPPFASVIGVIPTRDSAVRITFNKLRTLHEDVLALVDGDVAGDNYASELLSCVPPPLAIVQWPTNWSIEDIIGWVIAADEVDLLASIGSRLDRQFTALAELTNALKNPNGSQGGLKAHYLAHEEIAGAIKRSIPSVQRADRVLEALTRAALGKPEGFAYLSIDSVRSLQTVKVYRFSI